MKVSPLAAPTPASNPAAAQADARSRAVSAFMNSTPPPAVGNQNAIAPEEMGAIKAPSKTDSESELEATAETTEESVVEETAEETKPKEDPALSRQFAQLARQEKQIRQMQAQLKAEKAQIDAERAKIQAPTVDMSRYIDRSRLSTDPLSVLAEAGISYDTLTEQLINQQAIDPRLQAHISKLEAKLAELETKSEESSKSAQAQEQAAYDAAIKQLHTEAKRLAFTDPSFELIKATNSVKDVVDLIERNFKETGEVMSVDEAAQTVEKYLEEEAEKLAKVSKIQKRLQTNSSKSESIQVQKQQTPNTAQPQPMKTLTNASSSSRQLSAKERAILAFKGELK